MLDYGALYREMYERHPKKLLGSKVRGVDVVTDLVDRTKPRRLLDYGCGSGQQYTVHQQHKAWGGPEPECYDIGVPELARRPIGKFDGVICSDMMEHIAPADVDAILHDIFGFLTVRGDGENSFAYFHISCVPAKVYLSDGRNAHLTIQPPQWWRDKLSCFKRMDLLIEARFK